MKKFDKNKADQYLRIKTRIMIIFMVIWAVVSYGVVSIAEYVTHFTVNGMPFHYFMGAQGSIVVFIILLWAHAMISDKIDKDFGLEEVDSERESSEKMLNH